MRPRVDIALATYNGSRYLDALLESLVAQDYDNIQVVVSDDASTDTTRTVIESFKDRLDILFIGGTHTVGVVANFERAIANCSGNYIALADQDDVWHPQKVSVLVAEICRLEENASSQSAILAFSDIKVVDEELNTIAKSFFSFTVKSSRANCFRDFALANHVPGCAMMMNRALITLALPLPKIRMHDFWFIQIAALNGKIGYVDKALLSYRQHSSNNVGIGANSVSFAQRVWSKLTALPVALRSRPEKWRRQAQFARLHARHLYERLPFSDLSKSDQRLLTNLVEYRSFVVLLSSFRGARSGERFIDTIGIIWSLAQTGDELELYN